jgi:hypothetical protein
MAIFYAVVGAIVGTVGGGWLARFWAPLGHYYLTIGSGVNNPWTINLRVVGIQAGFWLDLNLGGIIGLLLGLMAFQRRR